MLAPINQQLIGRAVQEFGQLGPLLGAAFTDDNPVQLAEIYEHTFALPCLSAIASQTQLLANIKRWALSALEDGPMSVVHAVAPAEPFHCDAREFTAAQCRGILANALLGNVQDFVGYKHNQGGLDFCRMIGGGGEHVGIQKLAVRVRVEALDAHAAAHPS